MHMLVYQQDKAIPCAVGCRLATSACKKEGRDAPSVAVRKQHLAA